MIRVLDIAEFEPDSTMTIWDVRDSSAYHSGHIAYAINKPVDELTPDDLAAQSGTVYVLCGGGTKAQRAVERLNGFDDSRDIVHLVGGTRGAKALGWTLIEE